MSVKTCIIGKKPTLCLLYYTKNEQMNIEKHSTIAEPRRTNLLLLIDFLKEKPRPIHSIVNHLGVHRCCVYVYLNALKDLDVDIKKDELKKYYI